VLIACLLALASTVTVARATQHQRACEGSDVRIEGTPTERWAGAVERVCTELAAMKDRDASASVRLIASGEDLVVDPAPAPAVAAPVVSPTPSAIESPSASPRPDVSRPDAARARAVELALSTSGRVGGGGSTSLAPTLETNLIAGHWLFGLWARWDVIQHTSAPLADDFEMDRIGAGLAVARRIDLSAVDLDIGFSPRFIVETQSHEIGDEDETRSATDIRLGSFARVMFGRAPVRVFATVDGEVSPGRLRREVRLAPALPALPAWSAGVALGVAWTSP
jgi:hypothetical protein